MRLTPAMNMPEELFNEMFARVNAAAEENKASFKMVQNYGNGDLATLLKAAFLEK